MNQLINITLNDNQEPVVSGRDLHKALEIKTQYTKWLERMSDYGFEENEDYLAISQKRLTAQGNQTEFTDHILKLDMAKEIAMLQRNEKSKQIRKYFIQVEKDFNSPEKIMQRALLYANQNITKLEAKIEADKPKVLFADAVSASQNSILVGELAKLLKQNGIEIGATRLFAWLRDKGYLIKRKGRDWNMPTQKSVELGIIRVKETSITHSDGHITVNKTPLITGKGQQYFINKFLAEGV